MSYAGEHRRLAPVLALARQLDIATNPDQRALFESGTAGFQIWCTLEDHPQGWDGLAMLAGAFCKPCEYLASVGWGWEGEQITHLLLSTDAYALQSLDRQAGKAKPYHAYRNRGQDLSWAIEKVAWLFEKASVSLPEMRVEE